MAEVYTGPKFQTTFSGRQTVHHPWMTELIGCARRFGNRGWADANNGYLAVRHGNGMVIKAAGAHLATLGPDDLTEVIDHDPVDNKVLALGPKEPSSETAMAWLVFRHRPEVNAIVHIHAPGPDDLDDKTRLLGAHVTVTEQEDDYGTLDIAKSCLGGLRHTHTVWLRDHGYVTVGASLPQAELRLLQSLGSIHGERLDRDAIMLAEPITEDWRILLGREGWS